MRAGGISFLKATKSDLIQWNSNLALKFIPGQSHKSPAIGELTFFAYSVEFPEGSPIQQGLHHPRIRTRGCSTSIDRVKIVVFKKEIPTTLSRLGRYRWFFKALK
jgi:hypothetical protein